MPVAWCRIPAQQLVPPQHAARSTRTALPSPCSRSWCLLTLTSALGAAWPAAAAAQHAGQAHHDAPRDCLPAQLGHAHSQQAAAVAGRPVLCKGAAEGVAHSRTHLQQQASGWVTCPHIVSRHGSRTRQGAMKEQAQAPVAAMSGPPCQKLAGEGGKGAQVSAHHKGGPDNQVAMRVDDAQVAGPGVQAPELARLGHSVLPARGRSTLCASMW